MYSGGQRISPGNRTESRQGASPGRQQSCPRQGERAGHHRGLRAGHVFRGVIRELGRTSRLLGEQPPEYRVTGTINTLALAVGRGRSTSRTRREPRRNTKDSASTQGTGREPQANRPGRTKVVVATHSTAGPEAARPTDRKRGEPRPKGPTIKAAEAAGRQCRA